MKITISSIDPAKQVYTAFVDGAPLYKLIQAFGRTLLYAMPSLHVPDSEYPLRLAYPWYRLDTRDGKKACLHHLADLHRHIMSSNQQN